MNCIKIYSPNINITYNGSFTLINDIKFLNDKDYCIFFLMV